MSFTDDYVDDEVDVVEVDKPTVLCYDDRDDEVECDRSLSAR